MTKPKQSRAEKMAEKYFDKWWNKKDRYHASFQLELPAAYLAGFKAGTDSACRAVELECVNICGKSLECAKEAKDAIRKRSRS